jgi:hypothetical protein
VEKFPLLRTPFRPRAVELQRRKNRGSAATQKNGVRADVPKAGRLEPVIFAVPHAVSHDFHGLVRSVNDQEEEQ